MKVDKNKIKYILMKNKRLFSLTRYTFTFLKHRDRLLKKCSFGNKHADKQILIIRPSTEDGIQGLMSLLIQALRWMDYANKNNMYPVMDYLNYKTQYYTGKENAWEVFFKQPARINLKEAYQSKNVTLTGVTLKDKVDNRLFREGVFSEQKLLRRCSQIIKDNIVLSDEVEDCIGVYIRGTDYVKLKPAGEFKQPDIQDVIIKVREFTQKYPDRKIFLVTEDEEYYDKIKSEFVDKLLIVSFDSFISGYDGKNYLSKTKLLNDDKKRRGIDYLVKIVMLSRCKYLISSITMGSIAAYCFNGGQYEEDYIFDLGFYA